MKVPVVEPSSGVECMDCGEVYVDVAFCPREMEHWTEAVSLTPCEVDDCDDEAHDFGFKAHVERDEGA